MNKIGPADANDLYAVAMLKKQQDDQKEAGERAVRLIQEASQQPRKVEPKADSTVTVVA
jgi:hypothetical protein